MEGVWTSGGFLNAVEGAILDHLGGEEKHIHDRGPVAVVHNRSLRVVAFAGKALGRLIVGAPVVWDRVGEWKV